MVTLHSFFFNVYPCICLAVFLMGSLARFDRDQYTWKSDSSQLLRAGQLRWGSNLFHIGILTFRPDDTLLYGLNWPYKIHLVLGMTIFLLFQFSRLVHVWSGFATLACVFRAKQVVRSRRLDQPTPPKEPWMLPSWKNKP